MSELNNKDLQELVRFYKNKCSDIEYEFLNLQILAKNNLEEKLQTQKEHYEGLMQRAENEFFIYKNNLHQEVIKLKKQLEKNTKTKETKTIK
jgi:hypothetical protein